MRRGIIRLISLGLDNNTASLADDQQMGDQIGGHFASAAGKKLRWDHDVTRLGKVALRFLGGIAAVVFRYRGFRERWQLSRLLGVRVPAFVRIAVMVSGRVDWLLALINDAAWRNFQCVMVI